MIVLSFSAADDRRVNPHLERRIRNAHDLVFGRMLPYLINLFEHNIHDLFVREPFDRFPACETMRDTNACKKYPKVIIDLSDRSDRRTGV